MTRGRSAHLAALALVMIMFAAAEIARAQEIVFPEIAALALGAWVMREAPWRATALTLWLSPTLAALTGVLLVRLHPGPLPVEIGAAFLLVAVQLALLRSAILPALSAAILPIVTRTGSWSYPLSVCVLAAIVSLGRAALARPVEGGGSEATAPRARAAHRALHWGKLLAGVLLVSAVAWRSRWLFMMAPPLAVMFVEMANPEGALRARGGLVFLLLVIAACSGVFWIYALHRVMQAPMWLAACLSLGSILLVFHAVRLPFPPAAAIALLPAIIPARSLWLYPLQVSAGSAVFWLMSAVAFGGSAGSAALRRPSTGAGETRG
jgi:hypothetical protein